jgi:hypothetical protein
MRPATASPRPTEAAPHPEWARRDQKRDTTTQAWVGAWLSAYTAMWLIEGVLRKWIVPQLSEVIYFARDVGSFAVLAALVLSGVTKKDSARITAALGVALAVAALIMGQAIATAQHLPSLLVGAVMYASPLVTIALFACLTDRAKHRRRIEMLVLGVLPLQAALTVVQTLNPDGSFWNRVGDNGVGFVTTDEIVRATGTFVAPSGLGSYVVVAAAFLLARLWSTEERRLPWTLTLLASLVVVLALGGSRGPILGAVIVMVAAVLWAFASGQVRAQYVRRFLGALVFMYLAFEAAGRLFPRVVRAFERRIEEAGEREDAGARIFDNAFVYLDQISTLTWLGDGAGSHSLAGIAAGSRFSWIEIELARWVSELGALGLALAITRQILAVGLLVATWKAARLTGNPTPFFAAIVLAQQLLYGAVAAPTFYAGAVVVLSTTIILWWPDRQTRDDHATGVRLAKYRFVGR